MEKDWEESSSWNYDYQWLDHCMCLSPGELQLVKWRTFPMRRKSLISDLFSSNLKQRPCSEKHKKHKKLCLAQAYPQVPLWLLGNWDSETEIAAGHWEATSRGKTRLWVGVGDRCMGCIGRKHWGKGRCVQKNRLGFYIVLGKPFAGQEEWMRVRIKKFLFHAKFQAAFKPSLHPSSTSLPKQINKRVMQLPTGQSWILQAGFCITAATGFHRKP